MPFVFSWLPFCCINGEPTFLFVDLIGVQSILFGLCFVDHDTSSREIHWRSIVQSIWAAIREGFQHLDFFQLKWVNLLTNKSIASYLQYERVIRGITRRRLNWLKLTVCFVCLIVLFFESSGLVYRACECFICQHSRRKIKFFRWCTVTSKINEI